MTKRLQIVLVSRIDAAHRVQKENTKAGRSCRYCDFYISKSHASYNSYKKLRAQNRTYDCVRVRAYLVDFSYGLLPPCFRHGDGESQSALPRRGTKSHLILQSRRQVLLVVDEEGQFGADVLVFLLFT